MTVRPGCRPDGVGVVRDDGVIGMHISADGADGVTGHGVPWKVFGRRFD